MLYFFNQMDGETICDDQGSELSSLDEARAEAVMFAGQLMRDRPSLVSERADLRIEVTDANALVLFMITVTSTDSPAIRRLR